MTDQPLRGRWGIACLLGFGVLVNYFDRVNLSVAHDCSIDIHRLKRGVYEQFRSQ